MKTSGLAKRAVALVLIWAVAVSVGVASANDQSTGKCQYVLVTGSRIPQKVKVKAIGTKTSSPVRIYKRREIDQTGRFTVRDVLAQDPSLQVTGH